MRESLKASCDVNGDKSHNRMALDGDYYSLKNFSVSDWLKSPGYKFFITSYR